MAERDFDKYATDAIERKRERRATWLAFCDRHGWEYYGGRHATGRGKQRWSRRTFKYALERMPKDHEDRGLYLIGSKYAPTDNAKDSEAVKNTVCFIMLFFYVCSFAVITPISLQFHIEWINLIYLPILLVTPYYFIQRHRALSL